MTRGDGVRWDSRPLLDVGESVEHDGSVFAVADFGRVDGVA